MILDARKVRCIAVLDIEVGRSTERESSATGEVLVDVGYLLGDVAEGSVEELESLVFHGREGVLGYLGCFASIFKVFLCGLETRFYAVEAFNGANIGIEFFEVSSQISDLFLKLFFNVVLVRLLCLSAPALLTYTDVGLPL